jgi:hypothetical protein
VPKKFFEKIPEKPREKFLEKKFSLSRFAQGEQIKTAYSMTVKIGNN